VPITRQKSPVFSIVSLPTDSVIVDHAVPLPPKPVPSMCKTSGRYHDIFLSTERMARSHAGIGGLPVRRLGLLHVLVSTCFTYAQN
jgi:hypothetical protein